MSILQETRIADALEARRNRLARLDDYGDEALIADLQGEIIAMRDRIEARPLTAAQLRGRAEQYVEGFRQGLTGPVTIIAPDLALTAEVNRADERINALRINGELHLTRRLGYAVLESPLRLGNAALGVSDFPAGLTFRLGDQVRVMALGPGDGLPENMAEALCRSAYLRQRKHLFAGMDGEASFGMMQTLAAFSFIARHRGSQLHFDYRDEIRVARYTLGLR